MLGVGEASALILAGVRRMPVERVSLLDALGRVLASPVAAPLTLPPWDNSAMDGYAVRGDDVAGASAERPVSLPVAETIAAGAFASRALAAGEAMRIMTGAPLPAGADTVVRVEDTDGGTTRVTVRNARDVGRNVRFAGEDLEAGRVVLDAGTPIGAAQIGVLASCGAATVDVYRRPRVAILGSGDELVDLDRFHEALAGRKIVSSNSYTLHALVRQAGGEPCLLGTAADTPESLREHVLRAAGCDLIVSSAGASVGEFDYTQQVMASLGADIRFWKVRMRPGAPIGFGVVGGAPERDSLSRGTPWICLPGNPVSAMVTFELFARPAVRRMLGHTRLFVRPMPVVLEETVTTGARLTHFLRVVVSPREGGGHSARLTGPQGSGILTSMALANALLVVPEDRQRVDAGETLSALPLGDGAAASEELAL